jgi:hypothetical protein
MFGRQRRKHLEALEELHDELAAADVRGRAVLADAIAQIEVRLARDREDRERAQLSTRTAIENSQSLITAQANDVGRLLQQVASTCALVAEQLEADRSERRALADLIARVLPSSPAPVESRERALGGTVFAAPAIADSTKPQAVDGEVDLRDPADPRVGGDDASSDQHRWTYGSPEEERVDLRTQEDTRSTSHTPPRWTTT